MFAVSEAAVVMWIILIVTLVAPICYGLFILLCVLLRINPFHKKDDDDVQGND